MFTINVIGNLGADAKVQTTNGKEYISFRVAHSETFTKADGSTVENTIWISCFMTGRQKVVEYLKKGTKVFVSGNGKLDVYSSPKTHRMECGVTINVNQLELCGGGNFDDVPRQIFNDQGEIFDVTKHYWVNVQGHGSEILRDKQLREYILDDNGFVRPLVQANQEIQDPQQEVEQNTQEDQTTEKKSKKK